MAITPKCKNGDTLYVTPMGTLRPCCWMPEQMCWKTFDVDPKWDMKMTPLKTIKEKTVVEFAEKWYNNHRRMWKNGFDPNDKTIHATKNGCW